MPHPRSTIIMIAASVTLIATLGRAQTVAYFPDASPTTGASNTIPFQQSGGYTTLHFYKAEQLLAAGVAPMSTLIDFAVDPVTAGSGTYVASQAQLMVGHLLVDTPVPGAWTTTLDTPTIVHGLAAGAYTIPWTGNTWTSLPGFAAAGFVWDGVRDIGIGYTSASATGVFSSRTTTGDTRFGVTTFNATTQTPTTTGNFALKCRMTFAGAPSQANTPGASMTVNGSAGPSRLYGNDALTLGFSSTTAPSQPFFLFLSPSFAGGHLPLTGQSFDLGDPSLFFADVLNLSAGGLSPILSGAIAPFAALDISGNFSVPFVLPCGFSTSRLFLQAAIVDPSFAPDGIRLTGIPSFDARPACRFASSTPFPVAIPDGVGGVLSSIVVPPGTTIADLDVLIDITHPNYSDLSMVLDLNGTTVAQIMIAGPTDASDLGGRYQFSDEGVVSIDTAALLSGTLLIPGRYIPDSPLSVFDNLDAGGVWTLTVSDVTASNTGTLNGFSILINGTE